MKEKAMGVHSEKLAIYKLEKKKKKAQEINPDDTLILDILPELKTNKRTNKPKKVSVI